MGEDGDDIVSLPVPPPPRRAARREAIEAALARFDGAEPAPAPREPLRTRWATMHRRPAGALVAATLIAIVAIPAIQIALRDEPPADVSETVQPGPAQPPTGPLPRVAANEALDAGAAEAVAAEEAASRAQAPAAPPLADDERRDIAPVGREEKMRLAVPEPASIAPAPPALVAAPPPPPPPPPAARQRPAEPQAQAEANAKSYDSGAADRIVVTGSRTNRPNLESASPVMVIDPHGDFLVRLQAALGANDRRAVIRLAGLPLTVRFGNDVRTYRSARDIERDYDRIFTAGIRQSALAIRSDTLMSRDGGRLMGNGVLWFGCARKQCATADEIRIWEIRP